MKNSKNASIALSGHLALMLEVDPRQVLSSATTLDMLGVNSVQAAAVSSLMKTRFHSCTFFTDCETRFLTTALNREAPEALPCIVFQHEGRGGGRVDTAS